MKMKSTILALITVIISGLCASGTYAQQVSNHKKKHSTDKGTFFFYWGYNRSYYTKSDIRFVGSDYDFKLKNVTAYDRPDTFSVKNYFSPNRLTIPQYNGRLGYYFNNRWAITVGVDHYKYVMADQNHVLLDGHIGQGVDSTWSGNYNDQPVVTDRNKFHYENTNGCNFIRFELMRSFDLYELGKRRQIALTGNIGAGVGPCVTFNDLNFGGRHTIATPSLSGFALGLNGSLRLEFFKHFFVQMESGLGYVNLVHVKTRPDDRNQFARQDFCFSSYFAAAGVMLYLHPKNGCDSCPNW